MVTTTITQPKRKLTYADYLNTPDDDNYYELIDGELVMVPPPIIEHQRWSVRLSSKLVVLLDDIGLGEVLAAPTGVILSDTEVVQPDVLFVSNERKHIIHRAVIHGAPDLVVEILSPSTARRDRIVKREMYARHGVREYWLVDVNARTITQLLMREGPDFDTIGVFGPGETLTSPTLGGFRLDPGTVV